MSTPNLKERTETTAFVPHPSWLTVRLSSLLLRIRPAQACDVLKKILCIRRIEVSSKTGHVFYVDPVSVFGVDLLKGQLYEPSMTAIVRTLLRPGDTFIDVGANEGYFSVVASAELSESGRVLCVEPQARLYPVIERNMLRNLCRSVVLCKTALAEEPGTVRLFLRPSTNTGASSMFRHWRLGTASEAVPATTLDRLLQQNNVERVRLMKVDCEGAEEAVVAGGADTFRRQLVQFIAMEYHPTILGPDKCKQIDSRLKECGYRLASLQGHDLYYLPGLESELARLAPSAGDPSVG